MQPGISTRCRMCAGPNRRACRSFGSWAGRRSKCQNRSTLLHSRIWGQQRSFALWCEYRKVRPVRGLGTRMLTCWPTGFAGGADGREVVVVVLAHLLLGCSFACSSGCLQVCLLIWSVMINRFWAYFFVLQQHNKYWHDHCIVGCVEKSLLDTHASWAAGCDATASRAERGQTQRHICTHARMHNTTASTDTTVTQLQCPRTQLLTTA